MEDFEAVWEGQGTAADAAPHEVPRGRRGSEEDLTTLVKPPGPETSKLYLTVCRWWKEIEVMIVTGATTGKFEANNTGIKHIKRTAGGYHNPGNYKSVVLMRTAVWTAA